MRLVYSVDGGSPTSAPMIGRFGAQAGGVIPAQTDAMVACHVECTDLAGNTGASRTIGFLQGAGRRTKLVDDLPGPSPGPGPAPQRMTSIQAEGSAPRSTP